MLSAIAIIAERKIAQAISDGTLETRNNRWHGKPLPQEDDSFVPDDLKMAYKILKNAGYLPPEIEAKKEIRHLEELIARTEDEHTRVKQMRKLSFLLMKVNDCRQRPVDIEANEEYHRRITEKISIKETR